MRLAILALTLALYPQQEEVLKGWKNPWMDAKPGDHLRWTIVGSDKKHDRSETVKNVAEGVVEIEVSKDGKTNRKTERIPQGVPQRFEGKVDKSPNPEELKLAGKSYKCVVYTISKDEKSKPHFKVWKCPDAKVWAVKEQYMSPSESRTDPSWVVELAAEEEVMKIQGKEYPCAVFVKTSQFGTTKIVEREWRNAELPGGVAKRVVQHFDEGKEIPQLGSTETLIEAGRQ